jgi:septum formation protein
MSPRRREPVVVLASSSPRRQELLHNAGIAFTAQPADVDEAPHDGEVPRACAERLAREKAAVIFGRRPHDFVLGADTVVVVGGEILGKPQDEADARRMLCLLSGRTHHVITGVCLIGPQIQSELKTEKDLCSSFEDTRSATTAVTMLQLSEDEIGHYVATGEPMDKAGAYAIQGLASRWIPRIEGDYFNVVGLPVALVYGMLREHGAL